MPVTCRRLFLKRGLHKGSYGFLGPHRGRECWYVAMTLAFPLNPKAGMDINYVYWLLHCPLAPGYYYKHKRIAAVIFIFRIFNYIKSKSHPSISPKHSDSRLPLQLKLYH